MQLFKTSSYEEPYLFPPTINVTEMLYVGVSLLDVTDNSTFVVSAVIRYLCG